jgi:hypothetical protein
MASAATLTAMVTIPAISMLDHLGAIGALLAAVERQH